MKNQNSKQYSRLLWCTVLSGLFVWMLGAAQVGAVENTVEKAVAQNVSVQKAATTGSAGTQLPVDFVSINVDGGSLRQVLNAFALQTGRNIVVGPNVVVSNGVTLHLNNVRWDEALDVVLKPYGFGYRKVGDTIVVSALSEISAITAIEPLETKVFNLRFLDAGDVQDMLSKQLSPRGAMSIMIASGQKGWEFASRSGNSQSKSGASAAGKLSRAGSADKTAQVKSKTLIVTDVPSSLSRVAAMISEIDVMPRQVLVESRFMEVNDNLLKDLGLDFTYTKSDYSIGQLFSGVTPAGVFNPAGTAFWSADLSPQAAFAAKSVGSLQGAIRALQKDTDTKVLSAPSILTLNNLEATIIVGQKYPIIQSDVSGGGTGGSGTTSTSLDYYENIGIQLNVVPQICDDNHINMIVHPSVSSIVSFESGTVSTGGSNTTALTQYPVIDTREAETQILLKNKETVVIGGLLQDQKSTIQNKVPFLGDIPLLGRLFRRDTTDNKKVNLLIFLSATIVDENNYDTIIAKPGEAEMPAEPEAIKEAPAEEIPPAVVTGEPAAVKGPDAVE